MNMSPTPSVHVPRAWFGALLLLGVAIAVGRPALGATPPPPPLGMVESPCPDMPAPPAEIHARTEMDLKPETPDPAELARPPAAETRAYLAVVDARRTQDWAGLCRYRNENVSTAREVHIRAVFLGDSITENWRAADPAFFTGGTVNRGIGGQTSPQMLVRFFADVVALHPRVVHIMAGTNDLAGNTGPTSAQQFKNNIMAMGDLAVANGVRVVLASIPPAAGFPWRPELRPGPQILELNVWLRTYAARRKFVYVDYYSALADANGAMRADLSHDGVHPHRTGYALMRPLAEHAILTASQEQRLSGPPPPDPSPIG